ncbi:MAG: hypothetical protein BWY69_00730 [Planctomycetes bacterium ADurb.Bin401]|nr:MAG: hypothetical protein BWY69_00730 [Planctomycetes bacterium ADurb.Bin401]
MHDWVDFRFASACQRDIRTASRDYLCRFAYRQMSRSFRACYRIARSLQIMNNSDMTRQHIRQIFQKPQRSNSFNAVSSPFAYIELSIYRAFRDRRRDFKKIAANRICPQNYRAAFRFDCNVLFVKRFGFYSRIFESFIRRDNRNLDIARHQLGCFANRFRHKIANLVFRHLACDLTFKARRVE